MDKDSYTRRELGEALLRLLGRKELAEISVSELCAEACVSRSSFYRSFDGMEDILRARIRRLSEDWDAAHTVRPADGQEALAAMFDHFRFYADFYGLLYRRGLLPLIKDVLTEKLGPRPEYPNRLAYTLAFVCSGIYGWIEEWFRRGMAESAAEMAALLKEKLE